MLAPMGDDAEAGAAGTETPRTVCPDCGYDLRGHAATATCPECGLRYDPHCVRLHVDLFGRGLWALLLGGVLSLVFGRAWLHSGIQREDAFIVVIIVGSVL